MKPYSSFLMTRSSQLAALFERPLCGIKTAPRTRWESDPEAVGHGLACKRYAAALNDLSKQVAPGRAFPFCSSEDFFVIG
jgi:hypothetical protein